MHARLTSVSISPDRIAEGNRIYQESVGPAVANLKGFRGAFLLSDPNTGESISMTLWETEADGNAYESSGSYQEQVNKLRPLFASSPSLKTYDVGAEIKSSAGVTG